LTFSARLMEILFPQTLRTAYRRVNKAGSFNTRCFPDHCPSGHADSSFCGRPFIVFVTGPGGADQPQGNSALFFAEFTPLASPAKQSAAQFTPEGFYGERATNGAVVFNLARQGWKYAWKSSRHVCDTPHVMRVYAVDPASKHVVLWRDSSPFVVSSMRGGDVGNENSTSSDLLIVLAAMSRLVPNSRSLPSTLDFEMDFGFDDYGGNDDDDGVDLASLDTTSVALGPEDEARFLAHERMRGLMQRLYAYMLPQYATWRCAEDLRVDVAAYLWQHESTTLETVAREAARTMDSLPVYTQPLQVAHFPMHEALAVAHSMLADGEQLCDALTVGGANDVSGTYLRNQAYLAMMGEYGAQGGWSPVDVDLHSRGDCVRVSALSRTQMLIWFMGPSGHTDLLTLGAANCPADLRPTMFGVQCQTRVIYAFAYTRGALLVGRHLGFDGVVAMKYAPLRDYMELHIQFRDHQSGHVLTNERFRLQRATASPVKLTT